MKRLFTFAGIVLASIALVCTGCNKPTNETDPEAPENADTHIEGQVIDSFGDPLIGASVIEKGTTNCVAADFDGKFVINLNNPKNRLIISYVGYMTKEVTAYNGMVVTLEDDLSKLDEVVVIGEGTNPRIH